MDLIKTAKLLRGQHTIESIAEELGVSTGTALNIVSRLRKEGYLKTKGGGRQKRIYIISTRKDVEGAGMYDLINKYSKSKLVPKIKHVVFGRYTVEHALTDAIVTRDFRTIHASLHLFNHIKSWKRLHDLAKKKGIEQEIGALYETARTVIKTRKMPDNILASMRRSTGRRRKKHLIEGLRTDSDQIKKIGDNWKIILPFAKKDLEELK